MSHPPDAHREDFSEVIEQVYKILGNRSIPEELENLKNEPRKFRRKFSEICAENNGEILRGFMGAKGAGRRTCHGLVDGVFVFARWCADLGITNIDAVEIYKGHHSHKLLQAFRQLVSFVPSESAAHIRGCACLECRWSSILDHYITTNSILPTSTIQRLVSKGVPEGIREEVWFWLSGGSSVALERNPHYKDLLEQDGGFGELIDLDVSRTFCEEKNWQKKGGAKILKRLLRAYSVRNPMVGYCQGMSYVAALLIDCCSEEVAFCCLCAIIEDGPMPPDYYTSLKGAVVDRLVLEELAEQYLKGLCGALENEQRSLSEFSFLTIPWYLCLFTATLPVDVSTRIWDFYLANGICVIFRVSLGILMVAQGPIVSGEASLNDLRDLIEKSLNEVGVCDVPDYCMAFNKVTNTVIGVMRESKRKELEKEEEVDKKLGKKTDNMDRCFLTVKDSPEQNETVDDEYFEIDKRRADSGGSSGRRGERLMQELGDFMMARFPASRRKRKDRGQL